MENNTTACSNCKCPINYDCVRFEAFFNGQYIHFNEFNHNKDYTCDEMITKEDNQNNSSTNSSLF